DEFRIRRILINTLGNAIKFTENGQVKLRAYLKQLDQNRAIICLEISDTGIGMEEDKIPLIFEKFSRLVPANTGKYKGYGLGLYLVRKFVDDLEGEIEVNRNLGKGSPFTITLPLKLPL